MIRPRTWISAAFVLALSPACGDTSGETVAGASVGETATTNGDTPGSTSGNTPTTGDSDGTGSGTTEPEVPFEPMPALGGIEVDWVEANQGVGVAIGRDGGGVGGSDRTSYLIQNRLTLIRAFWKQLPADWVPRKIEGRLIISGYPEGDKVISSVAMVEGESFIGNLQKSFYWGLMPEEVIPGLKYRIELWETESGYKAIETSPPAPGATPPKLPTSGDTFIGIEDSYQIMKVTLVPFNYNFGGCTTTPDTSEGTMQMFKDFMFMMNPLEKLELTIHEPINWDGELTQFGQLNFFMLDLRNQEGASPETYYFGLVDVCSGGLGGAGGQAIDIPSGAIKSDASKRISSGLSLPKNAEWSAETFVHEVGHSQGRYHIHCNGQEAGTDNSYPNETGDIAEWGFGVINYKLFHPTVHKDYMTYCHPVWASTFGWNKTYPIIQELSSWDMAGAPAPSDEDGTILFGVVYPDGSEQWTTTPGAIYQDNLSAVQNIEFFAGGQPFDVKAVEVRPQPDSDAINILAELPDNFDEVTHFVRNDGEGKRVTVKASALTRRPTNLKAN